MSIDTEHASGHQADAASGSPGAHSDHDEHGLTDKGYVMVALILGVMTAAEVALSYLDLPGWFFMTALLSLMAIKFLTVVSFFMHLKFDNRLFSWLFYTGVGLAVGVYITALFTFEFFAPG